MRMHIAVWLCGRMWKPVLLNAETCASQCWLAPLFVVTTGGRIKENGGAAVDVGGEGWGRIGRINI